MGFDSVSEHFSFPDEELKVLKLWEELKAFETQLTLSEGRPPYSFYDGPPFATGLPHYGHLLAGTIKVSEPPSTLPCADCLRSLAFSCGAPSDRDDCAS